MTCLDENLLLDLSSGRLSPEREAEVDAHVDGCPSCRRLLTEWIRALPGGDATAEPKQLGRYQVLEPLGAGAMGVVYAAHDPQLNRRVCVKVLRHGSATPDAQRRLVREAQALARLAHPNVVAVHDVGEWEGRPFIAMELVEGKTLAAWLAEAPRPWRAVVAQFEQAGRGLAAAHAAGLVHRDFKPENVLVASDGRVRVTDFGLARVDVTPDPSATAPAPGALDRTAEGALVGTPAYMAPEQLRGENTDARTDQFGFCVALYSALSGQRPFAGDTLAALRSEVLAGRMRAIPSTVPARIGRVLARGLAARPDDRFPSMDALLRALVPAPAPWRAPAAAAAAAVVAALGWLAFRPAPCTGAEEAVAAVWNPAHQEKIRAAFEAAAPLYAKASFDASAEVLDRYAAGWVQMHGDACRATRVAGDQTEAAMDLRMGCLARRLAAFQALVTQFESAGPEVVERSVETAAGLAPLAFCADVEALSATLPPPAQPETRRRVEALRAELTEGLDRVKAASVAAQALGYPPVEAEAFLALGRLQRKAGAFAPAEEALHRACEAAEAGRHQEAKADAWLELAALQGHDLAHPQDGHRSAAMGRAALNTQMAAGMRGVRLLAIESGTSFSEGKYADALTAADGALAALKQLPDAEPVERARVLNDKGNALGALARFDEGEAAYREALALYEARLGPNHPSVAKATDNLGRLLERKGKHDDAIPLHRRAIAIYVAAFGEDHAQLATFRNNLGIALKNAGHRPEALVEYQRALAIWEKTLGPDNPKVANALNNIGVQLELQGALDQALAAHQRALTIRRAAFAADHPKIAESLVNLGLLYLKMNRLPEALESEEAALAIDEKKLGPDHPDLADELTAIGQIQLRLGAPARAIPVLERAVPLRVKAGDPIARAETTFALAQALWKAKQDRPRARALASEAAASFGKDAKGDEVRGWLAHPQ